jgi:hypothetical protein
MRLKQEIRNIVKDALAAGSCNVHGKSLQMNAAMQALAELSSIIARKNLHR